MTYRVIVLDTIFHEMDMEHYRGSNPLEAMKEYLYLKQVHKNGIGCEVVILKTSTQHEEKKARDLAKFNAKFTVVTDELLPF